MKNDAAGSAASIASLAARSDNSTAKHPPLFTKLTESERHVISESLHQLPEQLRLTPVKGKRPYLDNWQNRPLSHGQVKHQILANGATGYGLITGNGLLAIDSDGPQATTQLNQLGELPETLTWTSGKSGCSQRLYQLSKPLQRVLEAIQFTRQFIDCGGEQLDFRYNRCQSVLPPSWHPETGHYEWIISFADCNIAPAPDWLETLLIDWALAQKTIQSKAQSMPKPILKGNSQPIQSSTAQLWGDKPAPGRIASNKALMTRWNLIDIIGKGQTNSVLLEFCRLIKESGVDCETAIAEFKHFAPQIPGYQQYASKTSRHDLEKGTWAERIVVNWFKKDGYSGHLAKRDTDLNQTRQDAALKRILEAVGEGLEKGLTKVSDWISWIQSYCYKKWGIKPGLKTLYRHLELWHPKHRKKQTRPPSPRVELREGVKELDTARNTGVFTPFSSQFCPQITLWALCTLANVTAPNPKPVTPKKRDHNVTDSLPENRDTTRNSFRKGDLVVFDDGTGIPICGRRATITALLPDGTYRLNITYTGKRLRPRQYQNAVEAYPSFLRHAPSHSIPVGNADVTQNNHGANPNGPTEVWVSAADIQRLGLKGTHFLLDAIGGAAPQLIRPHEVPKRIWQRLLTVGGGGPRPANV